jgi:hypothetical protein
MKKLSLIIALICTIGFVTVSQSQAQNDRKFNKESERQYKDKRKELKKEGYKISVTTYTLDFALMKHYRTLRSDDNNQVKIGAVTMCKSLNVCQAMAFNNAANSYASQASSFVRGRVTSEMSNNASEDDLEEFDRFYAAYENLVSSEIKSVLKHSMSIEKPNGNGKSFESWYIINEESASKSRMRAMENAAAESKLAREHAEQISNFVQEGFEIND